MELLKTFSFFITLLIICNPMAGLPVFLILTQRYTLEHKKQTAIKASIAVGGILIGMTFVGSYILDALSIRVCSFQVMAGLVLIILAFNMLNAETSRFKNTEEEETEALHKESISIVPLAIPLIAGPGAISTIIIQLGDDPSFSHQFIIAGVSAIIALIIGIIWYFAGSFERRVGQTGINIITRIGGLILGAISLQTFAEGLIGFFPILGSMVAK